jgi:hypothetical protein
MSKISSNEKEIKNKKSITLFIQGHGEIRMNGTSLDTIQLKKAKHVTVLNIPGGVYIPGISLINPGNIKISHNRKKNIPELELQDPQLDLKVVDYLHKSYKSLQDNHEHDRNFDVGKEGMKLNEQNIHLIYANENLPYFHFNGDNTETTSRHRSITREPTSPFTINTPRYNKIYFLHPSKHEDCLDENECIKGNCSHTQRSLRKCPEYGITIIHSSVPEDIPYTLSGMEMGKRLCANLNQTESRERVGMSRYSTYEYWKHKLNSILKRNIDAVNEDIRNINSLTSNANIKRNLFRVKEELLDKQFLQERIYNMMTKTYDIDKPVASLSWMKTMDLPKVQLIELIDVLIDGMGFDHVYIIDPTCNYCLLSENRSKSLLQLHTHNIIQKARNRTVNPSEFSLVLNRGPRLQSDDNAVYRVRNSQNTRRVDLIKNRHPTVGGKKSKKRKTKKQR